MSRKTTGSRLTHLFDIKDDIRTTLSSCDPALRQLRDDVLIAEVNRAVQTLEQVVKNKGVIWLCGSGFGHGLAVDAAHRLMTSGTKLECPTRHGVFGLNGEVNSTEYGREGTSDAYTTELLTQATTLDALWIFSGRPGSASLVNVAAAAAEELKIPVVVFTAHPGTPLVHYATAKVQIQGPESDRYGFCVEWLHMFLTHLVCTQLRRAARHVWRKGSTNG